MIRHIAFGCAVLSLLVLAVATVAGGMASPGHDHLTRYISELGATGAPSSDAVGLAFMVSGALLAAFRLLCADLFPRSLLSIPGFEWLGAAQRVVEIALAVWTLAVATRLRAPVRRQTGVVA